MSAISSFNHLTLNWEPRTNSDRRFNLFVSTGLAITLLFGLMFSYIDVPNKARDIHVVIPDRIANFLTQKKKPKDIKVKSKPLPKPRPVSRIKKKQPVSIKKKIPLTKKMKKARKKAEISGLLALNNELADLMDTSIVTSMVSGRTTNIKTKESLINKDILNNGAGVGSGGIKIKSKRLLRGKTKLSNKELTNFRSSLLDKNTMQRPIRSKTSKASVRLEEQVTITFDQNKSKLYALYNRARRKNPSLKGKLILEITISSSGIVSDVQIIVSELNDNTLEQRIISRVKQFNFGASGKDKITVTFPIEFIPS